MSRSKTKSGKKKHFFVQYCFKSVLSIPNACKITFKVCFNQQQNCWSLNSTAGFYDNFLLFTARFEATNSHRVTREVFSEKYEVFFENTEVYTRLVLSRGDCPIINYTLV